MILIRLIITPIADHNPYYSIFKLSFQITDPAVNFLKILIPPLAFYGIYYADFTVGFVLFSFLVIRNVYRSLTIF